MRSPMIAACLPVAACNVKDARWYGTETPGFFDKETDRK